MEVTKEDLELLKSGILRKKENFHMWIPLYQKYGMEIKRFGLTYEPKEGKTYDVTITEAMEFFDQRYSRTTINNWVLYGDIEGIKVNRKWLLNRESLQELKDFWNEQDKLLGRATT